MKYPAQLGRRRLPPGQRLEPITMRLTPEDRETLRELGRDWLAAKLSQARKRLAPCPAAR